MSSQSKNQKKISVPCESLLNAAKQKKRRSKLFFNDNTSKPSKTTLKCEFSDNFGTFVAVDDKYSARIPVSEDHSFLKVGDVIEAKITAVKPDGKLDLTLREKAYIQMDADAQKILELLDSYAGVLPFSEKASPEVIKRETGLSKAAFKRAIGRLYKERKITLDGGKIRKN